MMRLAAFLLALALVSPALAGTITGRVVSIHDGDTLTVLVAKRQVTVRLADIDAPEAKQPFGTRSRQLLANLCFNNQATARYRWEGSERENDRNGSLRRYQRQCGTNKTRAGVGL